MTVTVFRILYLLHASNFLTLCYLEKNFESNFRNIKLLRLALQCSVEEILSEEQRRPVSSIEVSVKDTIAYAKGLRGMAKRTYDWLNKAKTL